MKNSPSIRVGGGGGGIVRVLPLGACSVELLEGSGKVGDLSHSSDAPAPPHLSLADS